MNPVEHAKSMVFVLGPVRAMRVAENCFDKADPNNKDPVKPSREEFVQLWKYLNNSIDRNRPFWANVKGYIKNHYLQEGK